MLPWLTEELSKYHFKFESEVEPLKIVYEVVNERNLMVILLEVVLCDFSRFLRNEYEVVDE